MRSVSIIVVAAALVTGCGMPNVPTPVSPAPSPTAPGPRTVDGLPAFSVTEAIRAHAIGAVTGSIVVEGYWSRLELAIPCASVGWTGVLEPRCGELYGITDVDEPAASTPDGHSIVLARGPVIMPFIDDPTIRQAMFRSWTGGLHGPRALSVVGHFDDPRAEACEPAFRQTCRNRLVLERIISIAPELPAASLPPSPSPAVPARTPTAAEDAAATAMVDRYTAALIAGHYGAAFAMLSSQSRAHWGSLSGLTYDRRAFFESVHGRYGVRPWPSDVGRLTDWLAMTYGASIDLRHAVLVLAEYPALERNNAGYNLYIVAPSPGGLVIYDVR